MRAAFALCLVVACAGDTGSPTCATDTDCPASSRCETTPTTRTCQARVAAAMGEPCASDAECAAGLRCRGDWRVCTVACDGTCPEAGVCVAARGGGACVRACAAASDCPAGTLCFAIDGRLGCVPTREVRRE